MNPGDDDHVQQPDHSQYKWNGHDFTRLEKSENIWASASRSLQQLVSERIPSLSYIGYSH